MEQIYYIFIRRCSFLQLEINISHLLLVVELRETREQLSGWQRISPELDIPRNYVFINDTRCKEIGYRQYVKRMYDPTRDRFLDMYKYRDSGDNMITGLIKIL